MKSFIKPGLILIVPLLLVGCVDRRDQPVEDRAGLLSTAEESRLGQFHRHLLQELDIELKVPVLAEGPGDIDRAAVEFFEDYWVGRRTRAARGVPLVVDPPGRQLRMEIGYDLEGIFPDGFIGYVEERQMAPFFQAGRIGDAVEATVELLVGRALGEVDAAGSTFRNRPPWIICPEAAERELPWRWEVVRRKRARPRTRPVSPPRLRPRQPCESTWRCCRGTSRTGIWGYTVGKPVIFSAAGW